MAKTEKKPFHLSVIGAISIASEAELPAIGDLLKKTKVPENHRAIMEAWNLRWSIMEMGEDHTGVVQAILDDMPPAPVDTDTRHWPGQDIRTNRDRPSGERHPS